MCGHGACAVAPQNEQKQQTATGATLDLTLIEAISQCHPTTSTCHAQIGDCRATSAVL
jgi:hypothetical protein